MAMLGSCGTGAGGQLTELKLDLNWPFRASGGLAWLGGSLQMLQITTEGELSVGSLQGLSGLQELDLISSTAELNLLPSAHLPTLLTNLWLKVLGNEALPQQMASLSRLANLSLSCADNVEAAGYAPLSQLGSSLKKLILPRSHHLPACLPQLTSLEELQIIPGNPAADAASLAAALPQLTALTSLLLGAAPGMPAPPAELAGLARLRWLVWWGDAPGDSVLPDGPWMGSLQRLLAPAALLSNSLPQLAAAGQLEHLYVTGVQDYQGAAAMILHFVPQDCPSLRCVTLQAPFAPWEAAAAALRAQSELQLHIHVVPTLECAAVALLAT